MAIQVGKPVVIDSLQVHLVVPGEVTLSGALNTQTTQSAFAKQVEELHTHVVGSGLPSFTIDVRRLCLVNSSAIGLFVTWISRAKQAGYKTVFITDEGVTWHRLSFSVLKSLSPETVEIRATPANRGAEGRT